MVDIDLGNTRRDESQVTYTSPTGEVWLLAGTGYGVPDANQRVVLLEGGFTGGVANPDVTLNDSPTGLGQWAGEFTLPPLEGELSVVIMDTPVNAGRTFRNWRRSWTPFNDGVLKVIDRAGGNYWTPARLVPGGLGTVDLDPTYRRAIPDEVKWRGLEGCWYGVPKTYTGTAKVVPSGDMRPSLRLRWDGSPATVMLPTGQRVTLPDITRGSYFIDLNRGMSGHVTNEAGETVVAAWAALRGLILGVTLTPHVSTTWTLNAGVTLEVTPRYLTPWR